MSLSVGSQAPSLSDAFGRAGRGLGLLGLIDLAICAIAWLAAAFFANRWPWMPAAFYKAYLVAWLFFTGLSLGSMAGVMVHHLTGGEWGWFIRRPAEAAASVLPLMAALFIPMLFGLHWIYPWADGRDHHAVIVHQRSWLNPPAFIARFIVYFACWSFIAWRLRMLSLRRDRVADPSIDARLGRLSAVGLLIYFLTMSLAAVDWIMSIDPGWYSTVFGLIVCLVQAVTAVAMLIILLDLLAKHPPIVQVVRPRHFNDLATLLITAVILWTYHAFSQLLVIWMGNLQSEIPWYVRRSNGPWRAIAILLIFAGFLAPFLLLLQRGMKQRGRAMRWICAGILVMQAVNYYWMIAPGGYDPYPGFSGFNLLMTLIAFVAIGGLWLSRWLWLIDLRPLLPANAKFADDSAHVKSRNVGNDPQSGTNPGLA